jgi:glutaminyl-tRNA synthetase
MSIICRFPPEPSASLHLGHLKAMMIDFEHNIDCKCILRMDDTNPNTEKQEYVDGIIDDVKWLGFNPYKITYTSDYFNKLYEYAILLIKNNFAYVDLSNGETISDMRHKGIESEFRNKPIEWHLDNFEMMKNGSYKENEAVLRLKIDMNNPNHTLRDPIAYRILHTSHYRTGTEWKIYPSYDYSHGIVDAIENITYSYCTMEFYVRRDQYYWPINRLNELGEKLEPATVREFGRLSVENNYLSKRKIKELINLGYIDNFDDPRLLTIKGLKERGFTPELLKKIITENTGMSKTDTCLTEDLINHYIRSYYDDNALRVFGVIDPIKVTILSDNIIIPCKHPNHPTKDLGIHETILTNNIIIERDDFREKDDPSYYRLAPNKTIRLRYNDFFKYDSHDDKEIRVLPIIPENPKKIKGVIHWVSSEYSTKCIFEIYDTLLKDGKFNESSKKIYNGYIENFVMEKINENLPFQLERVGFFKFYKFIDGNPVFRKIIGLVDKYRK